MTHPAQNKIICILGMHRSGSSFLSGRLRSLGIALGDDNNLIQGDEFNQAGYFENRTLSYIGEEILNHFGGDHIRLPWLKSGWEGAEILDAIRAKATDAVVRLFCNKGNWGWKDPRNSLLLPFWKQIIKPSHYIIALRNPLDVACSLRRRNGTSIRHGSELWLLHAAGALANTKGALRKIVFFEDYRAHPNSIDRSLRDFIGIDSHTSDGEQNGTDNLIYSSEFVHFSHTEKELLSNTEIHPLAKELFYVLRRDIMQSKSESDEFSIAASYMSDNGIIDFCQEDFDSIFSPFFLPNAVRFQIDQDTNLSSIHTEYTHALAERDGQIASLNQSVAERDGQINCLNQTIAERDGQINSLNHTVADRDEQITSLSQSVAEHGRKIGELQDSIRHEQHERDFLFKELETILNSRSWKITRPLRATMRSIRHGHLDAGGRLGVFQFTRYIGRFLPVPISLKASVRHALVKWQISGNAVLPNPRQTVSVNTHTGVQHIAGDVHRMRPECCGLTPGLISVVLPVYDQAQLLDESIQSVLVQTYDNIELIIVNDGSTDGVETVLEKYLDHPKVRCFTQANQRLPKALSNGFSYARGEYWTWTSADNIMEPRMLELMVAKFQTEPDLGMVYADYFAIDDRGALLQDRSWRPHNRPNPASGEIRLPRTTKRLNRFPDNFIGPCFMYRGFIGRCLGDYDSQMGIEDYDYWMRINAFFEIRHLGSEDLLYRYRVHDNTLSAQANDHGIFDKVQHLMTYEEERARYFQATPIFLADNDGMKWLRSFGAVSETAGSLTDDADTFRLDDAGMADLLVLSSETAAQHLESLTTLATPTAVIFSPDDLNYQKLQHLLNRTGCLALTSSKPSADRVRLVASCPVIDMASNQSYTAAVAFSKNYQFFHATRTPAVLKRDSPRQLIKPAGRHVLLQVDSFTHGGMENVVIDLALSLQEAGFKVTIGNLGQSGDAVTKACERGLRVEQFPKGLTETYYEGWIKQNKINLVNAHYSIFGAAICREENIPFVETIHNSYVWLDSEMINKYREADKHISSYICVSNTAAQYSDVILGLDVSKMRVIPNGIDPGNIDATNFESNRKELRASWQVSPDAPVFLNVASIMATKAQLPLVKAFALVVKKRPDVKLVLLGGVMEKAYNKTIQKAVDDLELNRHVLFAGFQRDVARYYHAADVFVLPSYWEGWSLSLAEALANGLPCVITNVGSAYQFDNRPNVVVVPPPFNDITELNFLNLGKYVYGSDSDFEMRLADALIKASYHQRGSVDPQLAHELDRAHAYVRYAEHFSNIR